MHYLLMIRAGAGGERAMTAEDVQWVIQAMEQFDRELTDAGQNLGSIRLRSPEASTTVRVRDGEVLTTDGPFAEAKEQVGGIYLVEAADMQEARSIAARLPTARFGSVEIRPVLGIDLRRTVLEIYEP